MVSSMNDSTQSIPSPFAIPPPTCKRRWFQFRLRTLFIVITAAAVACAYVGWQAKIVRERKALRERFKGWEIIVQFERQGTPPPAVFPHVSWLRRLLGDEAVGTIYVIPDEGQFYWGDEKERYEDEIREAFPEAEIRYMMTS